MGTCSVEFLTDCLIFLTVVFGGFVYINTRDYVTLVDEREQGVVVWVAEKGSAELHLFADTTARLYTRDHLERPVTAYLGRFHYDLPYLHFKTGSCTGKVQKGNDNTPERLHVPDGCIAGVKVWRRRG